MFKLKVFGYPWHIGHQHALMMMPWVDKYHLLVNPYRKWAPRARPEPENLVWVPHFEPGEYDLAILHIDQQVIEPDHPKHKLFTAVNRLVDCPKLVINHMTPFHDTRDTDYTINAVRELIGEDTLMVVNSRQAAEQWGFGTPIRHGYPSHLFPQSQGWREPRIVSFVSPKGLENAYQRDFFRAVYKRVRGEGYPMVWLGVDHSPGNFESYLEYLSQSLVYFHGLVDSPMPRARTEAQHCGCCVVTTPYHDAGEIWEDGKTGFLVNQDADSTDVASLLISLISDCAAEARAIGEAGREMAAEKLGWSRYVEEWEHMLQKVL